MGILAAFAVPRYMDMQRAARAAKLEAIYGDIQAAGKMAHAAALLRGNVASITMEGVSVSMVNGYPAASDGGIIAAANLEAERDGIVIAHVAAAPPFTQITISGTGGNISGAAETCQVTYMEAVGGAAPTVVKDSSNC